MLRMSAVIASYHEQLASTTDVLKDLQRLWPASVQVDSPIQSMYDCHPYLFQEAFDSVAPELLVQLNVAAKLTANTFPLSDHGPKSQDRLRGATALVRAHAMLFEGYGVLHRLFPPKSPFWGRFRTYLASVASARMDEMLFIERRRDWQEFDAAVAWDIACGKAALAKGSLAGLAELSGDEGPVAALELSIDHFNVARQMLDDLRDWKSDLRRSCPSRLLVSVLPNGPAPTNDQTEMEARVGAEVYYGGHGVAVLEFGMEEIAAARRHVAQWPHLPWRLVLDIVDDQCSHLADEVRQVSVANVRQRSRRPRVHVKLPEHEPRPWRQLAWRALQHLLREWRSGFGEARHLMYFTGWRGFSATEEVLGGDVFQRAVIADVLCDANEALGGALEECLDFETAYLVKTRRRDDIGGWSYFPGLPELPADADDLAQMMQLLLRRRGRNQVERLCAEPLRVLLEECGHPDGSFETWIIPRAARSGLEEGQMELARTRWGIGADCEVNANILYAIHLHDPVRFDSTIRSGVSYVERCQQNDGSWKSTWYYGPYYGCYVCNRLLRAAAPTSHALQRSAQFIRSCQAGGGWAVDDGPDPLSTSLALLALASAGDVVGEAADGRRAKEAHEYLTAHEGDSGWYGCDLIRMDKARTGGGAPQEVFYSSRTMTTAMVLKAALAWDGMSP